MKIIFGLIATLSIILVHGSLCEFQSQSRRERESYRFELGVHYTSVIFDEFDPGDVFVRRYGIRPESFLDNRFESGIGGRFTYNVDNQLALEGEVNFIPSIATRAERAARGRDRILGFPGGEKTQALVGVKYGIRRNRFGVFGKLRPGLTRFNAFPVITSGLVEPSPSPGVPPPILLSLSERPATFFNLDAGGVFEYYLNRRSLFRVDVGDTIIRYGAQNPKEINPTFTRHNLQVNVGFGFRF